jgi:parallel beta-helix repeat protein
VISSNNIFFKNTANYNGYQGFRLETTRDVHNNYQIVGCTNNQLINNTANYNGDSGFVITEHCQNTHAINNTVNGTLWIYPPISQTENTTTSSSNLFKLENVVSLITIGMIVFGMIAIIRRKD